MLWEFLALAAAACPQVALTYQGHWPTATALALGWRGPPAHLIINTVPRVGGAGPPSLWQHQHFLSTAWPFPCPGAGGDAQEGVMGALGRVEVSSQKERGPH